VPIIESCRTIMTMGERLTSQQVAVFALPDGTLPGCEAAWLDDFRLAKAGSMSILSVLMSCVDQRRLGPLAQCVDALEGVSEALIAMIEMAEYAVLDRLAWMSDMAERRGPAAGEKSAAFTQAAPLMQVIRLRPQPQPYGPVLTLLEAPALPIAWREAATEC
jgi:hypothetical protein